MYPEFKFSKKALHRLFYGLMAALLLAVTIPLANMMNASAAQLSSRSIQMSDSSRSGAGLTSTPGTGTNVSYKVQFTSSSANIEYVIIDFCDASPIIADSCTTPTNFSATGASASSTTFTVANTTGTTGGFFKANISGYTAGSNDITISGITNPSSVGTFYARILLFTNANIGTYTSAASPGTYADYGGIALSTTIAIEITAKVQESLSFCVTSAAHNTWTTTNDCSDSVVASNLPALTIGHGSPNKLLDSTAVDTGFVYTQLSTNAINGAIIRLRGGNSCGGLSNNGGTNCPIPGIGSAAQMTAGTANFGLFVSNSVAGPNGVGSLTADANYNDGVNTNTGSPSTLGFGMDNTYVPNTSTYGDTIAITNSPVYRANITNVFGATAALTTPAGIYSNNYSMIATGTF